LTAPPRAAHRAVEFGQQFRLADVLPADAGDPARRRAAERGVADPGEGEGQQDETENAEGEPRRQIFAEQADHGVGA
jgi:hypothetical protein